MTGAETAIIVTASAQNGHEKTLLEPQDGGPVPEEWWPVLDDNDVCRYCLHAYEHCDCEENHE